MYPDWELNIYNKNILLTGVTHPIIGDDKDNAIRDQKLCTALKTLGRSLRKIYN
ncbi:MAG: hypothetical protein QXO72_04595 [Sulfolobales archaeon]